MNILVTGGAGFIGSHTVVELIEAGHRPIIFDNFSNSSKQVIKNLKQLTGQSLIVYNADIRDKQKVVQMLIEQKIDGVIHFAALKAVGESTQEPLQYYQNNIAGLLRVIEAMNECSINKLIFSSSATVYGDPGVLPITESTPLGEATNPYGATKQMGERILEDICNATQLRAVLLRYFNPIGAHPSALIGELPLGKPNNLVPYVAQVAAGKIKELTVFGADYDTPDGSGVRDYIHVVDLAQAHVKAIEFVATQTEPCTRFNLGTGRGNSVLEVIRTFEKVNNVRVPYKIGARRPGDVGSCYASVDKAASELGWKAEKTLEEALKDTWHWQQTLD